MRRCLQCRESVEETTLMSEGADCVPAPGDYAVCWRCGHVMAFGEDLKLREMTAEELGAAISTPEIVAILAEFRA
jgi:hypothetical protein